jgi:hypothetical protein
MALLAGSTAQAAVIDFEEFWIRGGGTATELPGQDGVEFVTPATGDKAGYGTDYFNGMTFGTLNTLSLTIEHAGGPWMPYLNIWIGDGTNYAIIANEPSNAPLSTYFTGNQAANGTAVSATFAGMGDFYVYETMGNTTWLTNGGMYLDSGRARISYTNLAAASWTIGNPNPGVAWGGSGAPDEGYGFNFVYGDTLTNYVSGSNAPGYIISDIVLNGNLEAGAVVPIPAAAGLGLLGMGLTGLVARLRKKKA